MKTKIFVIMLCGLVFSAFSQTKTIPSPDTDIAFDKEPVVQNQVQPKYPESMMKGGWESTVYVKAFIDVEGNVQDARAEKIKVSVVKSGDGKTETEEQKTDGKAFQEAALAAVKQWKFSPAQMHGKAVAAWVTIPFRFKLSGDKLSPEKELNRAEMDKVIETVRTNIQNVLEGKDIENAKNIVGKNAMLIYNTETVNLHSVLNNEYKKIRLTEGKKSECVNFNVNIAGEGTSMLIVWSSETPKGKNKRVHSIVLAKNPAKEWKIINWHVSF